MTRVKLFSFMLFLTLFGVLVSIPLHPQGFGKVNQSGLDMQLVNEAFLDLDGDTYNDSIFFAFKAVTAPASSVISISVEYAEKSFPDWQNWNIQYYNITTDSSGNAWFNTTISANASTRIYVYFGFSDIYGGYDSYYAEYYLDGLYLPYIPPVTFNANLLNSSTSDTDYDGYTDTFSGTFEVVDIDGSNTSFFDVYVYWYAYIGNLWWDSGQWLHIGRGYLNNNSGYFSFSIRFNDTATYDLSFYFVDAWNRSNGNYYSYVGRMDGYNTPWIPYDLYWPYPYVEEFNSTGVLTDSVKIRYDYSLSFIIPATVNYTVQVKLYYEENYSTLTFVDGTTLNFTFAGNSSSYYYSDFLEIIFPISKSGNYMIETIVWDTDTGIVWANDSFYYWLTYGIEPGQPLVWVSNTSTAIIDADGDNAFDTFVFDITLYSNASNLDIPIDVYFDIYTDIPNYGRVWYYNDTYGTLRSPGSLTLRSSFTADYEGNYTINIYVYEQLEWNTVFNYSTTVYLSPRGVSTSTSSSSESSLTNTSTLIDNPPTDNTTSDELPANDSVSDTASAPVLPLPIPVLPALLGLFVTGVILKKRKI